jgi:putative ABC transport system ATP-binding protein
VMEIFAGLREKRGITIVLITHERDIAAYGTRTVDFKDGLIVSDQANRPFDSRSGGVAAGSFAQGRRV